MKSTDIWERKKTNHKRIQEVRCTIDLKKDCQDHRRGRETELRRSQAAGRQEGSPSMGS